MKRLLSIVLMLGLSPAHAEDAFDRRMADAQRWEGTEEGDAYLAVLYGAIGNDMAALMQRCFPAGGERLAGFQFVADVTGDHAVHAIAFRPDTPATRCFADGFSGLPFPALPAFAHRRLPVALEMTIKP